MRNQKRLLLFSFSRTKSGRIEFSSTPYFIHKTGDEMIMDLRADFNIIRPTLSCLA